MLKTEHDNIKAEIETREKTCEVVGGAGPSSLVWPCWPSRSPKFGLLVKTTLVIKLEVINMHLIICWIIFRE